jgi:glutathione S-transferase
MVIALDRDAESAIGGDAQRDVADRQLAAGDKLARRQHLVDDRPQLVEPLGGGGQLTIGDIPLGIAAYRWFSIPVERDHHPNFEAWYGRLTERAAFKKNVMTPLL